MAKITNRDIARKAGVSPAAVSLAVHGKKGISDETRAHILEIMRSMNYTPVTRTRIGPLDTITLLVDEATQALLPYLIDAMTDLTREYGYSLHLLQVKQVLADPVTQLSGCKLLVTFDCLNRETLERFSYLVKQILIIDGDFSRKPFWNIRLDYSGAAYALTQYLADLGHRSFIYLNDDLPLSKNLICFSGFQRLMLEVHLPLSPAKTIMEAEREPGIWQHIPDIIRSFDVTAIVCTSESIAIKAIQQLQNAGYRVPEDISVAAVTLGVPRSYPNFSLTQISLCGSMSSYLCRLITKDTPPSEIVDYLVPYGSVFKGSSVIPAQFNPADKKLGLALYLRDHPTTRVVRAGFLKKCQEMGYQAVVASTELEDIRSYEDSLATLLDKNVDGVIAWRPSQKVFREFVQHGIPVVLIHNTSRDSTDYNEDARITASPTYIAKSVSDFLSKRLRGQAGILAVTHSRRNAPLESSITRELTQFLSTACPQIQVRHDFDFVGVKQEYTQMAQEFIESNPETLAVFSTAGIACVTWAEAKKAADRNDIIIVGTDYSDESIALTESGDIDAFVAHPIYEESQQGVAVMDAILRGKTYPYYQSLDAPLVTREGLEKYKRLMEEVNNWYA